LTISREGKKDWQESSSVSYRGIHHFKNNNLKDFILQTFTP